MGIGLLYAGFVFYLHLAVKGSLLKVPTEVVKSSWARPNCLKLHNSTNLRDNATLIDSSQGQMLKGKYIVLKEQEKVPYCQLPWGILVGKVQCLLPNQNLLKLMLQLVYASVSYYLTIYMTKVCKGNLNFYSRCLGLNFRDSWCPGIALPKIQFFSVSSLIIRTMVTNISMIW